MKIIDILNKMANGELEDGFSFGYEGMIYTYYKKENQIVNYYNNTLGGVYRLENCLNNEVLMYKEDEKVNAIEENKEIEELTVDDIYDFNHLALKINELVRAMNELKQNK